MDSDLIQQFRDLPRDSGARWQGKFLRMPAWIQGEGEAPYRPVLPLWLDVKYGLISTLQVTRRERAVPDCLLSGLVAFAIEERQYRPGHLEVMDSAVAEYLREALAGCGISVELVDQMEEMDDIQKELEKYHRQGAPRVASLLSAKSVTVDQLRSFADAAADFFRARLWLHLCDDDLIRIHTPKAPAGMQFAVVLGAGREVYGLGFYATAEEHYRLRNRRSGWQDLPLWQLSYDSVTRLPIEDADLWEDYDLAVADPNAYPTIAQFKRAKVIRPSARELNFMEGLLRVLAVASEEQIDRGRWTKTVACHTSGKTKYTLSIPDLVHPPTPQKWMRRGFIPDPRINEQMLLAVERFFVKNPVSNVDEMNSVMRQRIMGRTLEEFGVEPETPSEKARALCYQAIETFGRRRVQLARQALTHDANCVEAHVILAEMSATLDTRLKHYEKAVAAGEPQIADQNSGAEEANLWAVTGSRCHLRARLGLGETLDEMGRVDDAIEIFQRLMQLNPEDDQGVRYLLLPRLMATNRDVEAARLLKARNDESAQWAYGRAILAFRLSGSSDASRREIQEAFRVNPHLPRVLADPEPLNTDRYVIGSPQEAIICIEELSPVLSATPGVVDWILQEHQRYQREQHRNQRQRVAPSRKKR